MAGARRRRRLERRGGLFWILHLLFVLRRGGALFIGEDGLWYRGARWGKVLRLTQLSSENCLPESARPGAS